jgi:hypothetical protein
MAILIIAVVLLLIVLLIYYLRQSAEPVVAASDEAILSQCVSNNLNKLNRAAAYSKYQKYELDICYTATSPMANTIRSMVDNMECDLVAASTMQCTLDEQIQELYKITAVEKNIAVCNELTTVIDKLWRILADQDHRIQQIKNRLLL